MSEVDIKDLTIESYRLTRYINSGPTGVKITHIPTGITIIEDRARSQHINKRVALQELERVLNMEAIRSKALENV